MFWFWFLYIYIYNVDVDKMMLFDNNFNFVVNNDGIVFLNIYIYDCIFWFVGC